MPFRHRECVSLLHSWIIVTSLLGTIYSEDQNYETQNSDLGELGEFVVRHSQTSFPPGCPEGHRRLWDGYSFMYLMEGTKTTLGQDLGKIGSCVRMFTTVPFLSCESSNVCKYAGSKRNERSYWLASNTMGHSDRSDRKARISRCTVCQTPDIAMAFHSQSLDVPDCPSGWIGLWVGYSFIQQSEGYSDAAFTSPGSCLEDFRVSPLMECHGDRGGCHDDENRDRYWMAAVEEEGEGKGEGLSYEERGQVIWKWEVRGKVARCRVCMRNK